MEASNEILLCSLIPVISISSAAVKGKHFICLRRSLLYLGELVGGGLSVYFLLAMFVPMQCLNSNSGKAEMILKAIIKGRDN